MPPTDSRSEKLQSLQDLLIQGLNPEQTRAVTGDKSEGIQVVAGAGTGKTHLISHRFAYLIESLKAQNVPHPEEKILAVTFTVKAAREMQGRIQSLLTKHQMDGLTPYSAITNFHGFCNQLLRRHAFELGLTPDFSILGGLEQTLWVTRLFEGIKHNEYACIAPALKRAGLEKTLSDDILSVASLQKLPVTSIEQILDDFPALLNKIKSTGLSPQQFFETALHQSRQLTGTLQKIPLRDSQGQFFEDNQTYSSVWSDYLSNLSDESWHFEGDERTKTKFHEKKCEKSSRPENYDWTYDEPYYQDRLSWLGKYHFLNDQGEKETPFVWFDARKKVFLSGSEDSSFLDSIQAEEELFIRVTAAVYALYQYTLHQHNLCDFDDLINRSLELFHEHPELKQHYQTHYEAIIVDEFQDSNGSQLRLMQYLLKPDTSQITVVGDLKQSIYGFRHAQPENMGLIFENRNYQPIALHTNYRSQGPILAVANRLAQMIVGDESQRLELSPENKSLTDSSQVTWVDLGVKQEKETTIKTKSSVKWVDENIKTLKEREGVFIAREIAQLITSGTYEAKDIAVLVSTHKRADEIEFELRHLGIPAIKQKNKGFFKESVIQDAMALLRLLHNPHDDGAWVRILQKKLNQRQLRVLFQQKRKHASGETLALFQVLVKLSDSTFLPEFSLPLRTAMVSLTSEVVRARKIMTRGDLVFTFLHLADTLGLVSSSAPFDEQVEARMHLNRFKKLLYQLVQNRMLSPSLSEILATLAQYQADPNLDLPHSDDDFSENAVRLMTIHIAKGLEFPVVFVAYTEDTTRSSGQGFGPAPYLHFDPQYQGKDGFGLFIQKHNETSTLKAEVYKQVWKKPREESENKRKFYVAVTRAEEKLYVLRGPKSHSWTEAQYYPSEALHRINENEYPETFDAIYRDPALDKEWQEKVRRSLCPPIPSSESSKQQILDLNGGGGGGIEVEPKVSCRGRQEPLSFSKLKVFKECPTKYWLKYRAHLPEPVTDATQAGTCIHQLIEKHYVNEGHVSEAQMAVLLAHAFPNPEDPKRAVTRRVFQQFVQSEYSYLKLKAKGWVIESEKAIGFPLALSPLNLSNSSNSSVEAQKSQSVLFYGTLDLLLLNPETQEYTLIDFKTDGDLTPEKQAVYFQQLALYREGLKVLWPERELADERMTLLHLTPTGVREITASSSPTAEAIKQGIVPLQEAHQLNQLPEPSPQVSCARCPYQALCPKAH